MIRLFPSLLLLSVLLLSACAPQAIAPGQMTATVEPGAGTQTDTQPLVGAEPEAQPAADAEPEPGDEATVESQPEPEPTVESRPEATSLPEAEAQSDARIFAVVPELSTVSYFAQEEFFGRAINTHAPFTRALAQTSVISGTLALIADESNTLTDVSGQIEVDLRTLTSDDARRDRRIRDQYLESNRYPLAVFTPTAVQLFSPGYEESRPATFKLLGDLTVREITQPAVFDVTATLQDGTLRGTATTVVRMTDYGFNPPNLMDFVVVQDPVEITVTLTAQEQ